MINYFITKMIVHFLKVLSYWNLNKELQEKIVKNKRLKVLSYWNLNYNHSS